MGLLLVDESLVPIAYVCSSCLAYRDTWQLHFSCLPAQVPFVTSRYLILDCSSDKLSNDEIAFFKQSGVKVIFVISESTWGGIACQALRQVTEEIVIFTLDDFLIERIGERQTWSAAVNYFATQKLDYMKIGRVTYRERCGLPARDYFPSVDLRRRYAVSLQAAFWRRVTLIQSLTLNSDIWNCENSFNSIFQRKGYIGVLGPLLIDYQHHAIERGVWFRDSYRKHRPFLEEYNHCVDRQVESCGRWLYRITIKYFRRVVSNVAYRLYYYVQPASSAD